MKMVKPLASSLLYLSTLLLLLPLPCHGIPATHSFVHGGCSPSTANSTTALIATLLTSLLNTSSHSSFRRATITAPNEVVLQGLFQCRGDLSWRDCSSCVTRSVSVLTSMCPASGGAVQLQGCYVNAPSFPRAEEKSVDDVVVYKKFGGQSTATTHEVLNGLQVKGGPYRAVVGSNGAVVGQAQCLEELSDHRCQGCVAAAVNMLKTESLNSRRGDVFLSNCYARYSCNDGYAARSAVTAGSSDTGVNTFALIAGSLAGIVVLVIFLTFVCRECAGSSK